MNKHTKFRQTADWKKFRLVLIEKCNFACQLCGTTYTGKRKKMLQVHHLLPVRYDWLEPESFKVLCSSCHDLVERFKIKKSWGQYKDKWQDLLKDFMPKEKK